MLMSNRRKNAQICCFFRRPLSSILSINAHEWVHQGGFHFWGHELFLLGRHELILGTRIVHELFTICSELMRQLMGINGETFLAGSAPFLNPF